MIRIALEQSDPTKLSYAGIADVVERAIVTFKFQSDRLDPISDENFADIVTEEWAEQERKRITEELRQVYVDMSQLRDRMRHLFPSLSDPTKCGSCGGSIIRGDRVAPMENGRLKHLRCEGGSDADVLRRTAQAQRDGLELAAEDRRNYAQEKAESDAAWILFQDRQGGA